MESFFLDEDGSLLPPESVRIEMLQGEIYPDKVRVKVRLRISNFLRRPSGEITIENADGVVISNASFIEAFSPRMEFTLHLRGVVVAPLTLKAMIFYEEKPVGESLEERQPELIQSIVDLAETPLDFPG